MRKTEAYMQRLLEELAAERQSLLQRTCRFEEVLRTAGRLAESGECCAGGERSALMESLADVRDQIAEMHRHCADAAAERLLRWMNMVEELSRELSRDVGLTTVGELSASVAHEIRNPLCGILLSVEVLRTNMDPNDSRATVLDNLHRQAEKMAKVINNLLHFARHYKPRLVRCELGDVVMKSIESVKSHLAKSRTEVQVRPCVRDCRAEVDSALLQQVFGNILLNSVEACPVGSTIEVDVQAAQEAGHIAVAFRDRGEGIRGDLLDRVFDPFFTSKPNGIGLGLSVSKKIVEAHKGRIEVASRPGEGATFTVILPRRAEQQQDRMAA